MKKTLYLLLVSTILINCNYSKKVTINSLDGFWEIDKVIAPNGEEKPYNFNPFIDFFKMETDSTGYRKKLKAAFNGAYEGNNISQKFTVSKNKETYTITYNVKNTTWTEILIEASPQKIILQNSEGINYIYKPFTPIVLE